MKGLPRADQCVHCHSRPKAPGRNVCSDRCQRLRREAYARSNAKRRGHYVDEHKPQWKLLTPICPGCGCTISADRDCKCAKWIAAPRPLHHDVVRVWNFTTMKKEVEIR